MKKVISVVLAMLMLFACFGMVGTAEDATTDEVKVVTASDPSCVSLVFNYLSYDKGTVYSGKDEVINSGSNQGCVVIRDANYQPGNFVQLPEIKNPPEGYAGGWFLASAEATGAASGNTYACGSLYQIPKEAKKGEYIVFTAVVRPVETTSTIVKIVKVFAKVIGVLFGEDAANKFLDVIGQIVELD